MGGSRRCCVRDIFCIGLFSEYSRFHFYLLTILFHDCYEVTLTCHPLRYAQEAAGIKALIGVETEFILLSSTDPITPSNTHSWSDNLKLPSGSTEQIVMREIADNIQKAGIVLEMYHGEAAPGQVRLAC